MGGMQEEPGGVRTKTGMNDGNDSGVPGRWRAVGTGPHTVITVTAAAAGCTCVRAGVCFPFFPTTIPFPPTFF